MSFGEVKRSYAYYITFLPVDNRYFGIFFRCFESYKKYIRGEKALSDFKRICVFNVYPRFLYALKLWIAELVKGLR